MRFFSILRHRRCAADCFSVVMLFAATQAVFAQTTDPDPGPPSDLDALSLTGAPVDKADAATGSRTKIFGEAAAGAADGRFRPVDRRLARLSLDIYHAQRLGDSVRGVFSDRLDYVRPGESSRDRTVNSLREAYLSWQPTTDGPGLDAGRINLRSGPAYGYNPTDYFRDQSLRTVTTVNPFTLRESRLGTVALRGQQIWSKTSLSLVYSPKLANHPSDDGASLDLGSTNNRNRGLATFGWQPSERMSGQLLIYREAGLSPAVGANVTALVTTAATIHAEWSHSREPDLLDRLSGRLSPRSAHDRLAAGLTWTSQTQLSITAEYEYNGFALDRNRLDLLRASSPTGFIAYTAGAQRQLDLATRQGMFFYARQENLGIKNLDVTAVARASLVDHSKLGWVEARYRWTGFELALQLQQQTGGASGEYAAIPYRRSAQVLGAFYF